MVSFLHVFQPEPYMHHFSPPFMPHAHVHMSDLPNSTNHHTSHNAFFQFPPVPCHLLLQQSKSFPQPISSLTVTEQVSHPYKRRFKSVVLYLSILMFWIANWQTEGFGPNGSRQSVCSVCSFDWLVSLKRCHLLNITVFTNQCTHFVRITVMLWYANCYMFGLTGPSSASAQVRRTTGILTKYVHLLVQL